VLKFGLTDLPTFDFLFFAVVIFAGAAEAAAAALVGVFVFFEPAMIS